MSGRVAKLLRRFSRVVDPQGVDRHHLEPTLKRDWYRRNRHQRRTFRNELTAAILMPEGAREWLKDAEKKVLEQ